MTAKTELTGTSDPTAFFADDLSAELPKELDARRFEAKSLKKIFGKGYNDVIKSRKFYVIVRGGKGSKKSKTIALLIIMRMMQYPMANTVCIRKSYNALKDSMFTDLLWAIDRLGVTDWWEVRRSPLELELKHTHQVILFRGLDKAEKLGGLTVRHGYLCWMWIDEFYEITDEEEFIKAQMGLRGYMPPETGLWKQVFCTFNPWSEHTWIKKRFFDEPHDNVLAKVTTYKCNEWLSNEDRQRYDDLRETNPRIAKIICDGEWGIAEGLVYENWENQVLIEAGKEINYFNLGDVDPIFDFCAPAMAAARSTLEKKPEAVRKFIRTLDRAYREVAADPEGTVLEVKDMMPAGSSDSLLIRSQRHLAPIFLDDKGRWGRIRPERWDRMADYMLSAGVISKRRENEYTNGYFD